MTYLQGLLVYFPAILVGFFLVHLIWPQRDLMGLLLTFFLGIGAGLGLTSFLYFIVLLLAPSGTFFISLQLAVLVVLLLLILYRERNTKWSFSFQLTRPQLFLFLAFCIFLLITLASFINFSVRRDQGAFDAWMIYNRAARFIYRDTTHWQATLSPELYWGFHPDYPLMISLNVAWAWNILGSENIRAPLMQSGFFLFACIGLLFTGLARTKSIGQASIAAILLMSVSGFVRSGSGQTADVPLIFFLLAGIILLYLATQQNDATSLYILAGFMTGLAGWAKNEGLLAGVVTLVVLFLYSLNQKKLLPFLQFIVGFFLPSVIVLYFKIALAPPSDLFVGSLSDNLAKVVDPQRYFLIFKAILDQILHFGDWPFSIILSLLVYGLVFGFKVTEYSRDAIRIIMAIIGLQLLGYIGVYLITPHDLAWHLGTSFSRTIMQVFPPLLFLFFCAIPEPEKLFP